MTNNIKYLAVGRTSDHVIMCEVPFSKEGAEYSASVKQVIQASQAAVKGTKYSLVMKDSTKLNFYTDESLRIFICVTDSAYPERIAQQLLKDLRTDFLAKYNATVDTAPENGIKAKELFTKLKNKFDDPVQVDKLTAIRADVDKTTEVMKDTIAKTLVNVEKVEGLADDVEDLKKNAAMFGQGATNMKRTMQWQLCKQRIVIGSIVGVVLVAIILVIYFSNKKSTPA